MGVTVYSTVAGKVVLGLASIWLMVDPVPGPAPVIPPGLALTVHSKVLAIDDVNVIEGSVPEQILYGVEGLVTFGAGSTVTTMEKGSPGHKPEIDFGVTQYSTVPEILLSGFVNISVIVGPPLAFAPVIPSVMVPIVQVKLLGSDAINEILVAVPLQIVFVAGVGGITSGRALTVTLIGKGALLQDPTLEVAMTL